MARESAAPLRSTWLLVAALLLAAHGKTSRPARTFVSISAFRVPACCSPARPACAPVTSPVTVSLRDVL